MGSATSCLEVSSGQIYADWKIKKVSTLPKETEFFLDSQAFTLCDTEWHLRIYPSDRKGESYKWTGIYLVRKVSSPVKHRVVFTIGIKKADCSVYKSLNFDHCYREDNNKFGGHLEETSKLLDLKDTVIPDDTLTIFCNARLVNPDALKSVSQTSSSERVYTLSQNFNDLLLSGSHSDVKFKVKNSQFPAHRLILSTRCPVFRTMFKVDMKEKNTGLVNVEDCEPEIFQDFLVFLYTGKVNHVTYSNAHLLYKIADKYDVKELKEECALCMSREVSVETFCETIVIATIHNESKQLKSATDFFVKNMKSVLQSEKWMSLISENSTLANELLLTAANKD